MYICEGLEVRGGRGDTPPRFAWRRHERNGSWWQRRQAVLVTGTREMVHPPRWAPPGRGLLLNGVILVFTGRLTLPKNDKLIP